MVDEIGILYEKFTTIRTPMTGSSLNLHQYAEFGETNVGSIMLLIYILYL